MAHPYHHALSSVKKYGGKVEDYIEVHSWFDQTKSHWADPRHRAVLHSSFGIFLSEQVFGKTITNSSGRVIPVRWIGEQHVVEDCGCIPTIENWLEGLPLKPFMMKPQKLSQQLLEKEKEL